MMSGIFIVFRKEMLDNSRDRRTVLTSILLGPLLGPVIFVAAMNFAVSKGTSSTAGSIRVPIVGAEHAGNLVDYLASQGIKASAGHGLNNLDEAVDAVRGGDQRAVVLIDASFGEELAGKTRAHVGLVYEDSNSRSNARARRIRAAINAYSGQIGSLRLLARGMDPSTVRPLVVDSFDVSTPEARSSLLLGMLTYFVILATFLGGFYVATDTTSGERERKSLEPLLATPVPRSHLLFGKIAATAAFMLLSLALSVACFAVAANFLPFKELGGSNTFGAAAALTVFWVMAPVAAAGAALMTFAASFAKTYKEAQNYMGYVMLVPMLPMGAAVIMDPEPSLAVMAIPGFSHHLLVTNVIRSEPVAASFVALSTASTLLLAVLLALAALWLYRRERILG